MSVVRGRYYIYCKGVTPFVCQLGACVCLCIKLSHTFLVWMSKDRKGGNQRAKTAC